MEKQKAFGPRPKVAPNDKPCSACGTAFKEGDYTTLIALGPGDNTKAQRLARAGRAYNAVAVEVH